MAHEIDLGTAVDKAAQLNALLFQLSAQCIDPITDNLIELAHELSDTVSVFLTEECTKGNRDMSHDNKIKLENITTKIDSLTLAAISLDDEGDSELHFDLLDKVREVINKELKPAIFI